MCRVFGCVAAAPITIRHELLDAENPNIRQSEDHDSGWGMAVYERPDGSEVKLVPYIVLFVGLNAMSCKLCRLATP